MIGIEGAQPIRPYEPPISIVWTQGEPCTDADCALLTAALAAGDAAIIEYGHWGVYNMILRVGPPRRTRTISWWMCGTLSRPMRHDARLPEGSLG